MLKVDSSLNHIPAGRNHVIGLHESINQPLVNIPNYGTAPTGAFVLGTRNDQGAYTVFVYLHQADTRAVVVYVSEPRHLTHEQYRVEEAEALRFVESMGFMVDNVHFPTLAPPEQETVMERIPLFRPPQQTLDLYDVQDENLPMAPTPTIFGGLSAEDSALLQKSTAGPAPVAAVLGTPAAPPQPLRPSAVPGPTVPGSVAPINGVDPRTTTTIPPGFVSAAALGTAPPGGTTGSFTTGALGPAPATMPSHPATGSVSVPNRDPKVLARLGRLLGTFILSVAVLGACKSGGANTEPPRAVTANLDLGNQQLAQGQWAEAVKAFMIALEKDEDNFDALRGLGLAYLKLERFKEAEAYYQRSLEVNPASSLSRNELAVVYLEQRRCQEAVPLFEKVLEDIFYPTPEFAEHNLAQAFACLGRTDEAIDRLDKLVTKRPYFCLGYLTLSRLASKSRRPESTIRACDDFAHYCEQNEKIKELVLPQQSAMCYLRKGLAHAELGDVESARAAFERCQSFGAIGRECEKSLALLPR